jgi:hypothetical protein
MWHLSMFMNARVSKHESRTEPFGWMPNPMPRPNADVRQRQYFDTAQTSVKTSNDTSIQSPAVFHLSPLENARHSSQLDKKINLRQQYGKALPDLAISLHKAYCRPRSSPTRRSASRRMKLTQPDSFQSPARCLRREQCLCDVIANSRLRKNDK